MFGFKISIYAVNFGKTILTAPAVRTARKKLTSSCNILSMKISCTRGKRSAIVHSQRAGRKEREKENKKQKPK